MYSTNISGNRIMTKVNLNLVGKYKAIFCVFDTGAKFTTLTASSLGIGSEYENSFNKNLESKRIGGLIKSDNIEDSYVTYYKYRVKNFAIGDIILDDVDIWITFSARVDDDILGLDVIRKVCTYIEDDKIYVCNNKSEIVRYLSQKEEHKPNLLGELPDIDLGGI